MGVTQCIGVLKNRARTRCAFIVVLKDDPTHAPPIHLILNQRRSGVACFTPDWPTAARSERNNENPIKNTLLSAYNVPLNGSVDVTLQSNS